MSGKQLWRRGKLSASQDPSSSLGPHPKGRRQGTGVSCWERTSSCFQRWGPHTSQVTGGGWAWGRGRGCPGATHRSEASSLLMYSSRMLVSMLEGSRAPLMSWPVGEGQV